MDHRSVSGQENYPQASVPGEQSQLPDPVSGEERYLKNPLPVPKRRPHVRMEFDIVEVDDWDLPEEQDCFDFEISEDDDFDL